VALTAKFDYNCDIVGASAPPVAPPGGLVKLAALANPSPPDGLPMGP